MSKNIDHVQHIKSNVVVEGKPKLPQPSALVDGELAVNYSKGYETISLKNTSGDIVSFSSDEYYTEQKLGSGFTGTNSAVTVTDTILWVSGTGVNSAVLKGGNNTASGVCSVAEGSGSKAIGDFSHAEGHGTASGDTSHAEGTGQALGGYSHAEGSGTIANNQSEHASGQYNVSSSGSSTFGDSGNTLFSVGNGTADNARHNAFEIRQNGDIYIVNKAGQDVRLQDEIGNITVDQVLDDTTSASTNPVSSKAVYEAVTDNELVWTNAFVTLSGAVSSHTENTAIHVTAADKTNWNSVSGYADSVKYNDTNHHMEFYHGTTAGTKVYEFDASPFIIDGMVQNVEIKDVTSGASTVTCLVVSFNTDAGKQDINIPISDIFDASNYYNKSAIDSLVGSGFTSSSITDVIIENELIVATALNDLQSNKADASAVTSAITDALETLTLASSAVTSMAGYTMAASGTPITSADTLNQAIGKLEKQNDEIVDFIEEKELAIAASLTDLDDRTTTVETKILDNDEYIANINRRTRKDFTSSGLTWFINTLKSAVADQNLEKYGLKVGDYYTVTQEDGKIYNYVIAGLNTMRGTSTPYRLNYDHVGIIVDTNDTHAWNTAGNTHTSQNTHLSGGTWTLGTAAAGYASCDLQYYLETTVLPNVKTDLGSGNIKNHYKLYSTAVNTGGYNRFGSAGGCSSSWAWYASQEICALSEVQVYGSTVWSSSGYDTGEACRQLDVFRVYNMNEIFEGRYPWLRDVASSSVACYVGNRGYANYDPASHAYYVAALILFA